jgi:hypothetical protein
LKFCPLNPGFVASIRRYRLFTDVVVPVDQELAGASVNPLLPVLKARVIESPMAAIEFGRPSSDGVAGVVGSGVTVGVTVSEPKLSTIGRYARCVRAGCTAAVTLGVKRDRADASVTPRTTGKALSKRARER